MCNPISFFHSVTVIVLPSIVLCRGVCGSANPTRDHHCGGGCSGGDDML